jgi:hypothetical protein
MPKNNYIEEQKKFNTKYGINFSIDDHQIFQKTINSLNKLMFETKGSNDKASIYVDTLASALSTYIKSKTKIELGKTYDLSNLPLDKFVEHFDKVMQEKYLSELGENEIPSRKPFERITRESLVNVLKYRLQQFDKPLSDIWADSIINNELSIEDMKDITQSSISKINESHISQLGDRIKYVTNVVMAKQAMEKLVEKRSIAAYFWPGNWRRISRENKYLETLRAKVQEYADHNYPISTIISDNSKSVLASSNEKLENLKTPPKTEAELLEEMRKFNENLKEKENVFNAQYNIKEANAPENVPDGKRLVDKDILKIGYIPKPDALTKDYNELIKVQKYLSTFKNTLFSDYTAENGDTITYLNYHVMGKIIENNIRKIQEVINVDDPEELKEKITQLADEKNPNGWHNRNISVVNEIENLKEFLASNLKAIAEVEINAEEYTVDEKTAEEIEMAYLKEHLKSTFHGLTKEEIADFRKQLKENKFAEQTVKEIITSEKLNALNERYENGDPEFFKECEIPNIFLPDENAKQHLNLNHLFANENNKEISQQIKQNEVPVKDKSKAI